ncbi:chromatin-remodelling complex atpase iswi2 [Stylonychia lemnae]|uniref:Chromatin-remodelling complex atpase iswi2 n=1 Tax=Stylonychia lemnae TaxID=5949 RepID=A0A078A3L8_STYLE|nr:chromatin-remodelling complex atpase iswi2 [Stylonychia lemnae]|eukprot:CDW76777.1 chromatin-remodelling complex atpase iswi2 [Stylonychia lemnae]
MSTSKDRLEELLLKAENYARIIFQKQSKPAGKQKQQGKDEGKSSKRKSKQKISKEIDDQNEELEAGNSIKLLEQPSMLKNGKLQPHQLDSLNWMITLYDLGLNGILADDMGLGKTIQAITMLVYLYQYKKIKGPHLIITPKSTISNWMKEFNHWAPFMRVVNLNPMMEFRNEIIQNQMQKDQFDVCVTTYEAVNICNSDLRKINWHYQIYDEAHKLKNSEGVVSINSRKLSCRNRLLMTGTPLQNNIQELWSLLNYLMPEIFSSSDDFCDWFNLDSQKKTEAKMDLESIQKLHKIMRPFLLRRTKKDLETQLPDKIEMNVKIPLTSMQLDLYEQLLKTTTIFNSKNTSTKTYYNLLMQLRKVCNHPYLFENVEPEGAEEYGEHIIENSGKMRFLDKLLKKVSQQKDQALVFSLFTSVLDIIEDFCILRGYKYCRLDGSTDLDTRETLIKEFVEPGSDVVVFLLSTKAGGLGLNLMTANHVVLYDSDWNPQVDLQAMDRAHRIGQKKKVYVYRLICSSTCEEKIIERQAIKLKLDQVIIQQGKAAAISNNLNKDEYEKILLHGAAMILQQKQQAHQQEEIDIELLIQDGEQRALQMKEDATQQAEKMKNCFDFSYNEIDYFSFQNQDYRNEKVKFQQLQMEEQQKKMQAMMEENKDGPTLGRTRRFVHMRDMTMIDTTIDYTEKQKKNKDKDFTQKVKKQSIGMMSKVHDFQFYDNIEELKEYMEIIKSKVDNYENVTNEELEVLKNMLNTGFHSWTLREYQKFIKAIRKYSIKDVQAIAQMIETKTVEEVQEYMNVFMLRFRELKEKDIVISQLQKSDLDQKILETIRDFDINKDYVLFMQENNYFNRNTYLAMIENAHNKMMIQNNKIKPQDLQLKIDHFFHSQTKQMVQEQLKYITIAIRAEDCLRGHMAFGNERKKMRDLIDKSKKFSQGFQEGISAKEKDLRKKDAQQEIKQESRQIKRVGAIDDNLKFGRRKRTAALFQTARDPSSQKMDTN